MVKNVIFLDKTQTVQHFRGLSIPLNIKEMSALCSEGKNTYMYNKQNTYQALSLVIYLICKLYLHHYDLFWACGLRHGQRDVSILNLFPQ